MLFDQNYGNSFSTSTPNLDALIPLNRENSYNSNNPTFNSIPILEGEIRNLPGFLFTHSTGATPTIQSTYYISSERSLQLEYSAAEILGIGPVVMEIFWN